MYVVSSPDLLIRESHNKNTLLDDVMTMRDDTIKISYSQQRCLSPFCFVSLGSPPRDSPSPLLRLAELSEPGGPSNAPFPQVLTNQLTL